MKVVPTSQLLTNWSGELIDRSIFNHLKVGHVIRCYCKSENVRGAFYFRITEMNPLRGRFMDVYLQANDQEELLEYDMDLLMESIIEVPTTDWWNTDLKQYEVRLGQKYEITGLQLSPE